jgi:hypothetical protein
MVSFDNNNASKLNYKFKLSITPKVEYKVQSITIPGLTLGAPTQATPFVRINHPGNISYGNLDVSFLVGENFSDYLEIFNWMESLGYPEGLQQYENIRADCSVIILDSAMKPKLNVRFTDVFPTSLSGVDFASNLDDVQYITVSATFNFNRFYYSLLG